MDGLNQLRRLLLRLRLIPWSHHIVSKATSPDQALDCIFELEAISCVMARLVVVRVELVEIPSSRGYPHERRSTKFFPVSLRAKYFIMGIRQQCIGLVVTYVSFHTLVIPSLFSHLVY
ncbi:hypothetical protein ACOSQ3_027300 [Xanthoceras sorbifolium]